MLSFFCPMSECSMKLTDVLEGCEAKWWTLTSYRRLLHYSSSLLHETGVWQFLRPFFYRNVAYFAWQRNAQKNIVQTVPDAFTSHAVPQSVKRSFSTFKGHGHSRHSTDQERQWSPLRPLRSDCLVWRWHLILLPRQGLGWEALGDLQWQESALWIQANFIYIDLHWWGLMWYFSSAWTSAPSLWLYSPLRFFSDPAMQQDSNFASLFLCVATFRTPFVKSNYPQKIITKFRHDSDLKMTLVTVRTYKVGGF